MNNLIAIPAGSHDLSTNASAGVISFWRLSGNVSVERMTEALMGLGLDYPSAPSESVALKRAVDNYAPAKAMIKPLTDANGYTVLLKNEERDKKQQWTSAWSAWLQGGRVRTDNAPASEDHINDSFFAELEQLHSVDISVWLVKTIDQFGAISLRDTGGFYFVPGPRVESWNQLARAVERVSNHLIYTVPAMRGEQATFAILAGLTEEVEGSAKRMQDALDAQRMGARALRGKVDTCGDLISKIGTYESLLNQNLATLRDRMEELKSKYVQAVMLEESDKS